MKNKLDKAIKDRVKDFDKRLNINRLDDEEKKYYSGIVEDYLKDIAKAALEASKLEKDCYEEGTDLTIGNRKHIQNGFNLAVQEQHKIIKELTDQGNSKPSVTSNQS